MHRTLRFFFALKLAAAALMLGGCATAPSGIQQAQVSTAAAIQGEAPGDYFVGRRYYNPNYKFWGYVRKPGQPWSTSQLVMLNEKQKLAPDRAQVNFGFDNNYEYKLYGSLSGEKVYEPASNGIYPEFVLKDYEVISTNPPAIFKSQLSDRARAGVSRLTIERPQ